MMQVGNEFCGLFGCKSLTPTEVRSVRSSPLFSFFLFSRLWCLCLCLRVQSKTHFAAWTVSSSPLTLGANVTNATVFDVVYPIVTNKVLCLIAFPLRLFA